MYSFCFIFLKFVIVFKIFTLNRMFFGAKRYVIEFVNHPSNNFVQSVEQVYKYIICL